MQFYRQAGCMALGSRLRQLSARLSQDARRIYQMYGIGLNPRWFPVFYLLAETGPQAMTELADNIGHSHASVSQIVRAMKAHGLVKVNQDGPDGRVRQVRLSAKGQSLAGEARAQYHDVAGAVNEIFGTMQNDLWQALDEFEQSLDQCSFYQRVASRHQARFGQSIEIGDLRAGDEAVFKALNRAWIEHYFELEPEDEQILNHPVAQVIEGGGCILMARRQGQTVGTCALIKHDADHYELAKMAVAESTRGQGVGLQLGRAIIERARQLGAKRVLLESNTRLKPAIALYRKLGFRPVTLTTPSPYQRANIHMSLEL